MIHLHIADARWRNAALEQIIDQVPDQHSLARRGPSSTTARRSEAFVIGLRTAGKYARGAYLALSGPTPPLPTTDSGA